MFNGKNFVRYEFDPKKDYESWIQTDAWNEIRIKALDKANHQCERCGTSKRLQVHHKNYRNLGNERLCDLTVLCEDCHMEEHNLL